MSDPLRHASGIFLLTALATVPLDYGGTRPAGLWLLVGLVGAAAVCWSLGLLRARRVPWSSPVALLGLAAIVFAALLWLGQFVQPTAVADFTRAHLAKVIARWPHSVVVSDPASSVALHASLAFVFWITADLARDRRWLTGIAVAVTTTAVVVTVLALLPVLPHARGVYWAGETKPPGFFWGPFFHHTSAGAYLNTAWPLAAGLVVLWRQSLPAGLLRNTAIVTGLAAFIFLLGAHSSHISRFPQVAALVVMPFLLLRLKFLHAITGRTGVVAIIAGIALLAFFAGRTGEIAQRWHLLGVSSPKMVEAPPESQWPRLVREDLLIPNRYNAGLFGDRGEAQRTAMRAIAARPLTGHGPGNWIGAAGRFCTDPYVRSFYLYLQFTHEDFLQAWVELGLPGLIGLICLLPAAVVVAFRRPGADSHPTENILPFAAAIGLTAVLLQSLIDFPLQIPAIALNAHALAGLAWGWAAQSMNSSTPL